jgi:hypothetical protein
MNLKYFRQQDNGTLFYFINGSFLIDLLKFGQLTLAYKS